MDCTRADIAGFYSIALALNQISAKAIAAWADQEILRDEVPETTIIDLSLSLQRPFYELLSILNEMKRGATLMPAKLFAAFLAQRVSLGTLSEAEAANLLYGLRQMDAFAEAALGSEIWFIDEQFEPYAMGPDRAAQHVREFLEPYEPLELPPV